MKRRVLLFIIGSLLLPLGCGNDGTSGPGYETLVVTTTSIPNATATVAYSETLVATGGDGTYTWSVTFGSLPTGLSLTASTGLISGTPSVLESQTFTVRVASGDGQTDTRQLTITVEPPVLQPDELCSDYPDYAIATFEDARLTARILTALSVGFQEPLTCGQISGLTVLGASRAEITSLVGIQNLAGLTNLSLWGNSINDISALGGLTNLTDLDLSFNSISDISGLSGLTSLTDLDLSFNSISDIGGLSGLTSLTYLSLSNNSISDIGGLSGLTGLTHLFLHNNRISDISGLSGLTGLTGLLLSNNSISDISGLSGLTSLTYLYLSNNSIGDISGLSGLTSLMWLYLGNNPNLTDIQSLLDNTGLGAGDIVDLQSTSVSCMDVAALQAKGVTVLSDCP
ncbi:MAG: leucine-rich repeat domain-containing protein [Gemmatimonadales bacterium]